MATTRIGQPHRRASARMAAVVPGDRFTELTTSSGTRGRSTRSCDAHPVVAAPRWTVEHLGDAVVGRARRSPRSNTASGVLASSLRDLRRHARGVRSAPRHRDVSIRRGAGRACHVVTSRSRSRVLGRQRPAVHARRTARPGPSAVAEPFTDGEARLAQCSSVAHRHLMFRADRDVRRRRPSRTWSPRE